MKKELYETITIFIGVITIILLVIIIISIINEMVLVLTTIIFSEPPYTMSVCAERTPVPSVIKR